MRFHFGSAAVMFALLALAWATVGFTEDWVVELGTPVSLTSEVLERDVGLVVHLPPDYQEGERRYSVLVMIGSEFREQFAAAATTLNFMSGTGEIPGMILVGVDLPEGNGVLIPQREGQPRSPVPDQYLEFLTEELLPFVDDGYRTTGYRVIYGASNSGLFVVYSMLSRPQGFDAFLASSPMLDWCPELLAEEAEQTFTEEDLSRKFLYMIYSDDDYVHVRAGLSRFRAILEEHTPRWLEWEVELRHNEGHVPVLDLPMGLKALFPDYNPVEEPESLEQLRAHYSKLSGRYGYQLQIPASRLFDLGFSRYRAKEYDASRAIFEHSVELYPSDTTGLVGLAVVARDTGDLQLARQLLTRALDVEPESGLANRLLKTLPSEE